MNNKKKVEKPKSGYWYLFENSECVLCGSHEEIKSRQYTPKPDDPNERYRFSQYACEGHFM